MEQQCKLLLKRDKNRTFKRTITKKLKELKSSFFVENKRNSATNKTYYVKYKNQDGDEIEAMLQNPSMKMSEGDIIKIKYLPEKPNRVIRIK